MIALIAAATVGGILLTVIVAIFWAKPNDAYAYWLAGERLAAGLPIYVEGEAAFAPYAYHYTPPLAQIFVPLTLAVPAMAYIVGYRAIELFVEPADKAAEVAGALRMALEEERPICMVTVLEPGNVDGIEQGNRLLVKRDGTAQGSLGDVTVDRAAAEAGAELLAAERSEVRELTEGVSAFVEVLEPPLRLVICGAGHIALPLSRFGRELGFAVTVVDDRPDFAEPSRFPGCEAHSVVAFAAKAGVPLYTSSPGDSSIGMNIAYHELMNGGRTMIDPNRDVNEVCAIILAGKKNGCVILGGGSPKNFYLQGQPTLWEVYGIPKGGNDYFIQLTTDQVVWGGLSGATPAEAVSWGKVNPGVLPDTVVSYCDSTIAFPLFCEYAVGSPNGRRPRKELLHKRTDLVADLLRQARARRQAG